MTGAGKRRCSLVIQSVAVVPDADGSTTDTLTTFATVFADIEPLGGRELYVARAQQDLSTHRISFPYLAGVTPKMQGVYAGRTFNFTNVNNVGEMNREIQINATEVLA